MPRGRSSALRRCLAVLVSAAAWQSSQGLAPAKTAKAAPRAVSRRGVAGAALLISSTPMTALAADGAIAELVDGTLGLRLEYPAAWKCSGTPAFLTLLSGQSTTTCRAKGSDATVVIEARMVPALGEYTSDFESAITFEDVLAINEPDETVVSKRQTLDVGAARAYRYEAAYGSRNAITLFTVHEGDAGQYWAVTINAFAETAPNFAKAYDTLKSVVDSATFIQYQK
ncbi:hypothetical protein M885DRAFT_473989 [Pelagophyceae sp. CCMP2097]|nr:hypothetical protein M885DRAFT_473989 [Pelagophyceae sp. CCMP2097]